MKRKERSTSFSTRRVPYEGLVGAGHVVPFPIPEDTSIDLPVPDDIPEDEPLGTMQVCGGSLERVGILDGDIVLCRKLFQKKQITRDTVCIIYVPATGEVNAKKITFRENYLVLKYCGYGDQKDMYVPADDVEIRGYVISTSRHQTQWPFIDIDDSDVPL